MIMLFATLMHFTGVALNPNKKKWKQLSVEGSLTVPRNPNTCGLTLNDLELERPCLSFLTEMCAKMKELGPVGGCGAPCIRKSKGR